MLDFKVRRGLYEDLFNKDTGEPLGIIEAGCWYLCTDTAELFLGMSDNSLKPINGNKPTGTDIVCITKAEISSEGELVIYYSDGTEAVIGKVACETIDNGLVTSIIIGNNEYTNNDGVIELPNFATIEYVDEKLDELVVPEVDLSNYATKDDITEAIDKIDIPEVDLSDFYNKEEVEDIIGVAVGNIEIPNIPTRVSEFDNDAGYLSEVPDEFITESELAEKGYLTEHQSLAGYATEAFVTNKIAEAELNDKDIDLTAYYNKSETDSAIATAVSKIDIPDVSGFISEIPSEYVTSDELDAKGYLVNDDLASYAKQADIPNIDGLASEDYVQKQIGLIEIPETDLSDYCTKEDVTTAISNGIKEKADKTVFSTSKFVNKAIGGFEVGEDLNGFTVAELFAKLLGLSDAAGGQPENPDEPETPEEPKTLVEKIIVNKMPMYSITTDGELMSGDFVELDGNEQPTASGFFTIRGDNGEILKAGYQDLSIVNDEMYYIIALPKELDYNTMVSLEAWDAEDKIWVESDMPMTSDPATVASLCDEVGVDTSSIDPDLYTIWVYEDICTGSILRYVIKEDK